MQHQNGQIPVMVAATSCQHQYQSQADGEHTMKPGNFASRLMERLRPEPAAPEQDFADYGTAFALDLSIEAAPAHSAEPASSSGDPSTWWSELASQRPAPGL
jgi:hypothetical protein